MKALPGWAVDSIRDGAKVADLDRRQRDAAVFSALNSTALSAQARGHSFNDWYVLVTAPESRLGQQVSVKGGRSQNNQQVCRLLLNIWEKAEAWGLRNPPMNPQQTSEEARRRAQAAHDFAQNPRAPLTGVERAVLKYAAAETAKRRMLRVALPWRAVSAAIGSRERTTKSALVRLNQRGLLSLEILGRGGAEGKRRAHLYALPALGQLVAHIPVDTGEEPMGPRNHLVPKRKGPLTLSV